MKMRACAESVLAVATAVIGVVTAMYPSWFETIFEASPDEGSGVFEWTIAITLIVSSIALSFLARRDFRRVIGSDVMTSVDRHGFRARPRVARRAQ